MRNVAKATVVVGLTALLLTFLTCAAGAQTLTDSPQAQALVDQALAAVGGHEA